MPRRSAASLTIATPLIRPAGTRLQPPATLTLPQVNVWRNVVSAMPATWFTPEHVVLLVAYCRHAVRADDIELALADLPVRDEGFAALAKLAANETAKLAMLARSMRLTHQSRLKAETAASRAGGGRPDPASAINRLLGRDHG